MGVATVSTDYLDNNSTCVATSYVYIGTMSKDKFIKFRADQEDIDLARRVSKAVQKDLSSILRETIKRLAKKHGVK